MKTVSCFFVLCCLFSSLAQAEIVKHVIDGDTVILDNEQRVRLIGIDTPEVDHPKYNRQGEYYGEEARIYLKSRVEGKVVRVEDDHEAYDKYGRRLGYLFLDDTLLNRELIVEGYAEATKRFEYRYKEEFLRLENEARLSGKGMWGRDFKSNRRWQMPKIPLGVFFILMITFPIVFRFFKAKWSR
jgi:micrococcal nuclease